MKQSDFHVQGPQISQFNNIAPMAMPRSTFIRSFTRRTTFNSDFLVPIMVDEILPGDDLNIRMTAFTRMSTPIKPLMDNLYMETFWFFVPNRILWANWQKFQGQQAAPGDSTTFSIPVLDSGAAPLSTTGFDNQSVFDYFGLPTRVTGLGNISALFNRAYDLIWNEWFRDENLQSSVTVKTDDGPDAPSLYMLRKRNKRKDYLTSALPWPQKGTQVTIGLAGTAQIVGNGNNVNANIPISRAGSAGFWTAYKSNTNTLAGPTSAINIGGSGDLGSASPSQNISLDPNGGLIANLTLSGGAIAGTILTDLSTASGVSINALRQAALYQQILELDARGGTRYVESLYTRFGVVSPDFRLQRPELLGQGSTRINVYAVPQTAPTTATTTPQGNLAAFGTSIINGDHGCRYSATEHGILMALANVRADLTYQQKLPKMFTRRTRLDFYEPLLNGLGEQAVLNKEIFAQGLPADDNVFGYQERFAEYRYKDSEITGKFRSNDPQPLDVWHLSQSFGALPSLNSSFITEAVPMARVLAVNTEPAFLSDMFFDYKHTRVMPMRSNPGITRL